MSFFGKKILAFRTRSKKRAQDPNVAIDFESSQHFGLIYTWESLQKVETISQFQELLQGEDKEVSVLCFNPSKEVIDCPHAHFNVEAISSFGKIRSAEVDAFLNNRFDYLILIDFKLSETTGFLVSQAQAVYKVSGKSSSVDLEMDLMIDVNANAGYDQFLEQTIKYIKIIKHE